MDFAAVAGSAQLRRVVGDYARSMIPAPYATIGHCWGITLFQKSKRKGNVLLRLNIGMVESLIACGNKDGITEWYLNVDGSDSEPTWVRQMPGVVDYLPGHYKSAPSAWHLRLAPNSLDSTLKNPRLATMVMRLNASLITLPFAHRRGHTPAFLGWEHAVAHDADDAPHAHRLEPRRAEPWRPQSRIADLGGQANPFVPGSAEEAEHLVECRLNLALTSAAIKAHQDCLDDLSATISRRVSAAGLLHSHVSFEIPLGESRLDAAWQPREGGAVYVIEVKTLPPESERTQLRLGLGQVLDYAARVSTRFESATPVLLTTSEPAERQHWKDVCGQAGVELVTAAELDDWVARVIGAHLAPPA